MNDDQDQVSADIENPTGEESAASKVSSGVSSAARGVKNLAGNIQGAAGGVSPGGGENKTFRDAIQNGMGGAAGGGSMPGGMSGGIPKISGLTQGDTPNKLKALENGAGAINYNPADKKSGDQDALQKLKDKEVQGAKDTVELGIKAARIAGGDERAIAELAEHPVATTKKALRAGLFIATATLIPGLIIFVLVMFVAYKVSSLVKGIDDVAKRVPLIGTELRVGEDGASFLIDKFGNLSYEGKLDTNQSGVVYAAEPPVNKDELAKLRATPNPAMKKVFDSWTKSGLLEKFQKDYGGTIRINRSSADYQNGNLQSPGAWNLYVNNKLIGPLSDDNSMSYINLFLKQTTHWQDIYQRAAVTKLMRSKYGATSTLQYEETGNSLQEHRDVVVKDLVKKTMKPISENSDTYYNCLFAGKDSCKQLGIGTNNPPSNNALEDAVNISLPFFGDINIKTRKTNAGTKLASSFDKSKLKDLASSTADKVSGVSGVDDRSGDVAKLKTSAAEAVLSAYPKNSDNSIDLDTYLETQDRLKRSVKNGNYARVAFDRNTKQSIATGSVYATGGGQILNGDMNIFDAGVLTDNLQTVENSTLFTTFFGNSLGGVFAQGTDGSDQLCQDIFNDKLPADSGTPKDRETISTSCQDRQAIPDANDYFRNSSKDKVYDAVQKKVDEYNGESTISNLISIAISALTDTISEINQGKSRTSPLAAQQLGIDKNLGPSVDGNNNQDFGAPITGAEVNTDAFDSMWVSGDTLWNSAVVDPEVGLGGALLDSSQSASAFQYSMKMKKLEYAHLPVKDRVLSFANPNSLVSRLAMYSPTSPSSSVSKSVALIKPTTVLAGIGSRFIDTSMAASVSAKADNPVRGLRAGYAEDDPSNRMESTQLWNTYNCNAGGPTQTVGTTDNQPFDGPVTTNPCVREVALSRYLTCWEDTDTSSCGGESSSNTETATTDTSVPSGNVQELAQKIIELHDQGKITYALDVAAIDGNFKRMAAGQPAVTNNGHQVTSDPRILQALIVLANSGTVQITSYADGESHTRPGNPHYEGWAVDIGSFDGKTLGGGGGDAAQTSRAIEILSSVLPAGSRFGSSSFGSGKITAGGKEYITFNDTPRHLHVDVKGVN